MEVREDDQIITEIRKKREEIFLGKKQGKFPLKSK